jgi:hypothetical protein
MLIIIRHGRTEANATGRLLGRLDVPLDDLGERQAAQLAASLTATTQRIDRVVSSPLQRARQTADAGPAGRDRPLHRVDYGEYDSVPWPTSAGHLAALIRWDFTAGGSRWPRCSTGCRVRSTSWRRPTDHRRRHARLTDQARWRGLGSVTRSPGGSSCSPSITRIIVLEGHRAAVVRDSSPHLSSPQRRRIRARARRRQTPIGSQVERGGTTWPGG